MKQVIIMPGGFHPFHAGHYALYQQAQDAFPGADVYVAATNDTSARPFPFAVKEKLAKLAGVNPGKFIQVKSPFQAREVTDHFDPETTQLIFVRSEKDANKPPQAGGVKKNGEPSYLQPLTGNEDKLLPMNQRAYMAYLPTVEFGPGMTSATEIRNAWPTLNEKRKTALVMSLYPKTQTNPALAANVVKMLDTAMGTEEVNEGSEEALQYATQAHAGQTRSGGDPYITHPMRVADHIRKYKQSHNLDALISAAYLHDTIEDTDTTQEALHDLFGGLVASLVKELTSDPEQIKKMGKAQYLAHKMAAMSSYGLVIKLADRLDNVKDITTARTPQWRAKYAAETNQILNYIEKTRALSGTHNKLIELIRAKLAEIDNPQQGVEEGAPELLKQQMPMVRQIEKELAANGYEKGTEEYTKMFNHALSYYRKFGFNQGVAEGAPIVVMPRADRLKKAEPTKVRYQGDIVPPTKPPSTEKRGVKGRPGQRPMPESSVAEAGITRRGILKGIAGAGALGAAGKASAIAGAFPTPSHQAAMYKAAADSNAAQARADAAAKAKADAKRLQQGTQDVERLNKVNYHSGNSPKPTNAEWDGDSDFLDLDGTQYAKASRMPISGDVPSDLTLVSTKEGRQVYLWTRRSLKGVKGHYFYPAEKPNTINEGSQVERKISRIQAMIQDYYNRSRETRNDIKRDHYIDMARQLEFKLEGIINDANEQERDSNMVSQHDEQPSDTWNRGGLNEFAPDDSGGSRKFIPWTEFIEQVKQIVSKDFSCKENVVKSTIKARFVPHDPMEYGPTMLYSYYETRAGGRNKGAVSTRGSIQVGKYFDKGSYFNSSDPDIQNQLLTSFSLLKGHPFERHFDLTFDNIYKIANIIMGNTEGAYQMPQQQGVAEDYVAEKK